LIGLQLRPWIQNRSYALFDSDDLRQIVLQPEVHFLLPAGFRLQARFRASSTRQDRRLPGTDPDTVALNDEIAGLGDRTLYGGRGGIRVEQSRRWGVWGGEVNVGGFSHNRTSLTFAGDLVWALSENGRLESSYEHEEAGFELNTLAALVAGVMRDTGRTQYRHRFGRDFELSSSYSATYLSDSKRFGFSDNFRHQVGGRLRYRRFRAFQPAYSYSATSFRSDSPLYFSPKLYQAHRLEYLLRFGDPRSLQFLTNGSVGLGRIDGVPTFEFTVAPRLVARFANGIEMDFGYHFGRSRASAFGDPQYQIHGVRFSLRIPLPGGR